MSGPQQLVEVWRNGIFESAHMGHAVVVDDTGQVVRSWGDPDQVIFPRSSCKMIQALPLVESGAAAALTAEQLALACSSHNGAAIHTTRVLAWLDNMGLSDDDLRCGPETIRDEGEREAAILAAFVCIHRCRTFSERHQLALVPPPADYGVPLRPRKVLA